MVALILVFGFIIMGVALACHPGFCDRSADCDRQCLERFVDSYLEALGPRDPSRKAFVESMSDMTNNVGS